MACTNVATVRAKAKAKAIAINLIIFFSSRTPQLIRNLRPIQQADQTPGALLHISARKYRHRSHFRLGGNYTERSMWHPQNVPLSVHLQKAVPASDLNHGRRRFCFARSMQFSACVRHSLGSPGILGPHGQSLHRFWMFQVLSTRLSCAATRNDSLSEPNRPRSDAFSFALHSDAQDTLPAATL